MGSIFSDRCMLGGWPHIALDRQEFADLMIKDCLEARELVEKTLPKLAFSMNGQALSLVYSNTEFQQAMRHADYIQADGQSLVIASRFFSKNPLPERISTTDFFHDAAMLAEKKKIKFYLLGASDAILEKAFTEIKKLYPELKIVGSRHGYFDESEEENICREIIKSEADVLWVGLGKPKEQLFCIRNIERLRGLGWIKTCGGLFDFIAGKNKRAPSWMQNMGLEWLHRMLLDPKRLFIRYFFTNIHSLFILFYFGLIKK